MPYPAAPGITGIACAVAAPNIVTATNKVERVDERLASFIAVDPPRTLKEVRIPRGGRAASVGILWHTPSAGTPYLGLRWKVFQRTGRKLPESRTSPLTDIEKVQRLMCALEFSP